MKQQATLSAAARRARWPLAWMATLALLLAGVGAGAGAAPPLTDPALVQQQVRGFNQGFAFADNHHLVYRSEELRGGRRSLRTDEFIGLGGSRWWRLQTDAGDGSPPRVSESLSVAQAEGRVLLWASGQAATPAAAEQGQFGRHLHRPRLSAAVEGSVRWQVEGDEAVLTYEQQRGPVTPGPSAAPNVTPNITLNVIPNAPSGAAWQLRWRLDLRERLVLSYDERGPSGDQVQVRLIRREAAPADAAARLADARQRLDAAGAVTRSRDARQQVAASVVAPLAALLPPAVVLWWHRRRSGPLTGSAWTLATGLVAGLMLLGAWAAWQFTGGLIVMAMYGVAWVPLNAVLDAGTARLVAPVLSALIASAALALPAHLLLGWRRSVRPGKAAR